MNYLSYLTHGVLYDSFTKVRANFYDKIDENVHAKTYEGSEHDLYYAEPEFTGKFLDICAYYYERDGDERALKKGMAVVESIKKNIRSDGYMGMLTEGNELKVFSVWNHAFTLYGLTRMYEATKNEAIKDLVIKTADWIYNTYTGENHPDILDAANRGSENISSFFAMLRAYEVTGDRKYLDFVGDVIEYCETTDMNLVSFEDILSLRSRKGIEMIVVYLGVLKYGILTKNERIMRGAKRYLEGIIETQIRNTGNGTVKERWTEGGNLPKIMPTEEKPNETCVAVGIVELAAMLFDVFGEAKFLDVIEKSLFNHICGSLEKSGSDLAYYQGNCGKKIYRTAGGAYQCCRYRGFTLFSYLNDMLYRFDGKTLIPLIYAGSKIERDGVACEEITDFPSSANIKFNIKTDKDILLSLRIPAWCESYGVTHNGKELNVSESEQFITLSLPRGEHTVSLSLEEKIVVSEHKIDGKDYISVTCGPLLMAHDTHFGGELWQEISRGTTFTRADTLGEAMIKLTSPEMTLVDFASAGGNDPQNDEYTVFIPQKQ